MGKDIIAVFYREPDRFHHAVAGCGAVAGININMSAPEAFWTVIGIAVSCDGSTAMYTDKIFNVALKSFAHRLAPVRVA